MGLVVADDGWRISDRVWAQMEPLLPAPPSHSLGCHRPRVRDRDAMNAILLVLRTGMQRNALKATGICSCSSAYRRFREWAEAGVLWSSGGKGCLPTTPSTGSSGSGWRWTARSARRRWSANRPVPIQLTERKGGETIAPHGGQRCPARDRARARTLTTPSWAAPRSSRSRLSGPRQQRGNREGCASTRATTTPEAHELAAEFGFTAHIRSRGEEAKAIKREAGFRARRWVVERTRLWLNRFRRILTRWEERADTYLAMLHLASGHITWRATNWEPLSE
jgi:putative transposase